MRMIYWCLIFLGCTSLSWGQDSTRVIKTAFSDFPLEEKKPQKYKILELRYIVMDNFDGLDSVFVEEKRYKLFKTKNQAIEYYYAIRHVANKRETYYISAIEPKENEYFPFKEHE